ncbi:MAG: YihY family inner membrane protein [Burkholderiaceae bacterium]|jgi:membrane protein|nr:YihY family inner membrane protein [Burkholderiaceae bacterium]
MNLQAIRQRLTGAVHVCAEGMQRFPLFPTLAMLWTRFKQDRLGLSASSLTFTTTLALVPLFTVALSVFTAFPMFGRLQGELEKWLTHSLIPAGIANTVMDYLTQFSSKAGALGITGFAAFTFTAVSLVLTIDRTLNDIWRVRRQRPIGQRVLVYWAVLTLGPLALAASIAITSYVVTRSRGWMPGLASVPGGMRAMFELAQFALLSSALTLLYCYVPNTPVRWRDAGAGGLLACLVLTLARQGLGWYLGRIPTYSVIYGAFATLPILLLWIYLSWLVVLFGAVIAAYLPSLLHGMGDEKLRHGGTPGWHFQLALEIVQQLAHARNSGAHGLTPAQLAAALHTDALHLTPALDALHALDWVGQLATRTGNELPRQVLMADPAATPLAPLVARLLIAPAPELAAWRERAGVRRWMLADALE